MEKWFELVKEYEGQSVGKRILLDEANGNALKQLGIAKDAAQDVNAEIVAKATQDGISTVTASVSKSIETLVNELTAQIKRPSVITVTAGEEDKTKCFADFLRRMACGDREGLIKVYKAQKSALAEASGVTGGYLVPPEYLSVLMQLAAEDAIVRPRADVIPMNSRSIDIPMLDQTTVQAVGTTPYFGGVIAKWTAESATRNETEPTFKQIQLVAHELAGMSYVSRVLMADSIISVDKLLTNNFGRALGWYEDYAFLQGDGIGKPKGVLNSPACISVTRANTGSVPFLLVDVAKMYSKLLPRSVSKACWVMSQTVLPYLIQLADASGRTVYLPNPTYNTDGGAATKSVPMTLLGLPVMFTEKLPAAGTAGDVLLADFSQYLIGDRNGFEIASSTDYAFTSNQIVWRFIHRVDGQPWLDAPITYQDGSTQVSPFVKLS
jgi:HK97 family phage major capsid protein